VEIEQEMLDVMGWGFILWSRVQALKGKLAALEAAARPVVGTTGSVEPAGGDWRNPSLGTFGPQAPQDGPR